MNKPKIYVKLLKFKILEKKNTGVFSLFYEPVITILVDFKITNKGGRVKEIKNRILNIKINKSGKIYSLI